MRGRINLMDLYDAPFNFVHELYYYTFNIKEEREKERIEEEKLKKEEEEKQKKEKENTHASVNKLLEKRLSPAAQAREVRKLKAQDDGNKSEDKVNKSAELAPPSIDMEDMIDMLEEGG